jgi:hypothetical protein
MAHTFSVYADGTLFDTHRNDIQIWGMPGLVESAGYTLPDFPEVADGNGGMGGSPELPNTYIRNPTADSARLLKRLRFGQHTVSAWRDWGLVRDPNEYLSATASAMVATNPNFGVAEVITPSP